MEDFGPVSTAGAAFPLIFPLTPELPLLGRPSKGFAIEPPLDMTDPVVGAPNPNDMLEILAADCFTPFIAIGPTPIGIGAGDGTKELTG